MTNKIVLSEEVLQSIFDMAIEAIYYWAFINTVHIKGRTLLITYDDPVSNGERFADIDDEVLQRGADVIVNNPKIAIGVPHLLASLLDPGEGDTDSVDVIIQAGLFGDVVFG